MNPQSNRFTFDLPEDDMKMLRQLAADRGWSAGQYLRRVLAEHIAQLQQGEESP